MRNKIEEENERTPLKWQACRKIFWRKRKRTKVDKTKTKTNLHTASNVRCTTMSSHVMRKSGNFPKTRKTSGESDLFSASRVARLGGSPLSLYPGFLPPFSMSAPRFGLVAVVGLVTSSVRHEPENLKITELRKCVLF